MNEAQVNVEEIAMIIGQQRIEIFALQKQLRAALSKLAELEKPKPDA